MQQRDYLERLIQQIVSAIAKIVAHVTDGNVDEAERELGDAWSALGLRRADVARLDDTTLIAMLGAKRSLVSKLLSAEAVIARARGDEAAAARLEDRAAALADART